MVAVIAIFGIAWMSDTFVKGNQEIIVGGIQRMVEYAPWTFAIAMFAVCAFVKSQAATVAIMVPFGLALGLPTTVLLGVLPACYAHFFFCTYPGDLAAMSMDPTGTTRIGRFLLNHSFMMPGLIGVGVATTVSYFLSRLFFPGS
jgi:anaerobic C4-dicarboxylate transporter DcuB